jgi:ribosomal protein L11 methyltransferase
MNKQQHATLTFRVSMEFEDQLQGFMMMNATVEGIEEVADGSIRYSIPLEELTDELLGRIATLAEGSHGEMQLLGTEAMEVRDWNAEWEASIEPLRITDDLVISPSWKLDEAKQLGAKHLMIVDPKMSFGTGHHETTRLCLRAVDAMDIRGKSVLDIGTGSGVLAMYALMKGAKNAVGIDTDVWSIENAEENRAKNNFTKSQFDIRAGELQVSVGSEELFDLIFANIHRNVLLAIPQAIRSHLKPQGIAILSGLLIYDAPEVLAAFEASGFTLDEQLQENEWVALRLRAI